MANRPEDPNCEDFYSNPHFETFRQKLFEAGHQLSGVWSCRTGHINHKTGKPFKYDNLFFFVVTDGPNGKKPKVRTIMIQHYGDNGFGMWVEPEAGTYEQDIKTITG